MSTITNSPPSAPSTSKLASNAPQPPQLILCAPTNSIGLYPTSPVEIVDSAACAEAAMTPGPPVTSANTYTRLLMGPLDDFCCYSRQENTKWLMDIAHDICDPRLKRGVLQQWVVADRTWRDVNPADPLEPSTYRYHVESGVVLGLTKISQREGVSRTSSNASIPATMATQVMKRDRNRCWISRSFGPLTNSHICPKRTGDHLFRSIYSDFVLEPPATSLSIFSAMCEITLSPNMDRFFDKYEVGLRWVSPNEYECHVFAKREPTWPEGAQFTIVGVGPGIPVITAPLLHGFRTHPPNPNPQAGEEPNPPPGLFRWHYVQCVIKKFAHDDYKALPSIFYHELPLRMKGDSDDEGTDSDFEWPTAAWDRARAAQLEAEEYVDQQNRVAEWVSKV